MKMPPDNALDTAVMWLEMYEGGPDCKAVAEWIDYERKERMIRYGARKVGIPTAVFRRRMNETLT